MTLQLLPDQTTYYGRYWEPLSARKSKQVDFLSVVHGYRDLVRPHCLNLLEKKAAGLGPAAVKLPQSCQLTASSLPDRRASVRTNRPENRPVSSEPFDGFAERYRARNRALRTMVLSAITLPISTVEILFGQLEEFFLLGNRLRRSFVDTLEFRDIYP